MLAEFQRVVTEAQPEWWLLENSPRVPDIVIDGYKVQRIALNARECGAKQNRPRHFQFGSLAGLVLIIERQPPPPAQRQNSPRNGGCFSFGCQKSGSYFNLGHFRGLF